MDERCDAPIEEVLSYVEGDALRWEDAAEHCENLARNHLVDKQEMWQLLSAVYRERAKNHRDLVNRMRRRSAARS